MGHGLGWRGPECNDPRLRWEITPCLCDCHYGSPECGDRDKTIRLPRVSRIMRRRQRPE